MSDNPSSTTAREPYKLTLKRGFLALILMYVFQTLVGIVLSYGVKLFKSTSDGEIDIQIIGMLSVLLGGSYRIDMAMDGYSSIWAVFFTPNWYTT